MTRIQLASHVAGPYLPRAAAARAAFWVLMVGALVAAALHGCWDET